MSEKATVLVWAFDALSEHPISQRKVADVLKGWARGGQVTIYPLYVVSKDRIRVASVLGVPTDDELRESALVRVQRMLSRVKLSGLRAPEVILAHGYSLNSEVNTLIERAKQLKATAIFAGTYGRKGVARLLLGSFTETMLMHSPIPIVAIPPGSASLHGPIVFGTDFSRESNRAARHLVPLAVRTKSKIVLTHFVQPGLAYMVEPLSGTPIYLQRVGETWEEAQKKLDALKADLQTTGLRVETLVVKKGDSAATALAAVGHKLKARLVCVASTKGELEAVLAGSTGRQLVRAAKCPVWILPREAKIKMKREPKVMQAQKRPKGRFVGDVISPADHVA